jgi:hypothetical protein
MSQINSKKLTTYALINNIEALINNASSFENIKEVASESGIQVRESKEEKLNNLYLLVTQRETCDLSPLQLECNGLILEKNTNKIVCMSQNKFVHINKDSSQVEQIENLKSQYSKLRMEYCEDGTVIRLYNYEGQWYTATTRCIDARKSYWSSEKTFDDMFWEIFSASSYDIGYLDPLYTYSFILIHRENRIVVNHKYNNLIYINRINNETKEEDFTNYFYNEDPKRCIRRTKNIDVSSSVINYPLDDYYSPDKRGVIIKFLDNASNSWKLYQYDFNNYTQLKEVRGNVPLIRMRYLELLDQPDKLNILETNYPEHKMTFAMIKHCMNKLYKEVHNLYYQSHIKHNITVEETHKLYRTLKQLHGQYKKQGTIITLEEVIKKVNSLDKNIIKSLIGWQN